MDIKSFSQKNLYYFAAGLCLIAVIYFMGSIYTDNKAKNIQANAILANADGVVSNLKNQTKQIQELTKNYSSILPSNFNKIVNADFKLNELTRFFDSLEQLYSQTGTFQISSLSYEEQPATNFVDASISLLTSQENFVNFLSFVEQTGFANPDTEYLMEVRNVNFSVPELLEESVSTNYQVTLSIRIYKFK